jgi:hypothetical protein
LIEYGTEPLSETTVVVNPAWRQKDQEVRRGMCPTTARVFRQCSIFARRGSMAAKSSCFCAGEFIFIAF